MFDLRLRRGFSLIELLIVIAIILIIMTFVGSKMYNALRFTKETAALASIRTIHTAQVQYSSQYGRFANSLAELGPPASGTSSVAAADVIGSDLALGEKNGYKFTMTGNAGGYQISAVPVTFGTTGSRTFYSDQTMVVRENDGPEPATPNSKEVGAK
jgi:prepilin-type N-terminal cleavage/methylation domain-containing protein